jgi:hypothetical protein
VNTKKYLILKRSWKGKQNNLKGTMLSAMRTGGPQHWPNFHNELVALANEGLFCMADGALEARILRKPTLQQYSSDACHQFPAHTNESRHPPRIILVEHRRNKRERAARLRGIPVCEWLPCRHFLVLPHHPLNCVTQCTVRLRLVSTCQQQLRSQRVGGKLNWQAQCAPNEAGRTVRTICAPGQASADL